MPTAYTLDAFSLKNLSNLTELATQAAAEQVAICDKAEALGWDYIGRDSDRSTTVTINQKKCVFIATVTVGGFTDSGHYQFLTPEDLAELAAAGTDTTHYHSFTPQEAAVMGARSALRHPAALAAWFLRIHKAH